MLMDRIAGHSAEFAAAATDCTGWDAELGTASEARHFHASIVSSVTIQNQSLPVFNFEVEDDHSYIANGFAVHNCPSCVAMHGTEHELDEPGPLDHQQGRCSRMPLVKPELVPGTPTSKVESGAEWLQRQPEGVQRSVLGPGRFEAWKAGDYPASRWAVRRESEAWRPSYGPGPISG